MNKFIFDLQRFDGVDRVSKINDGETFWIGETYYIRTGGKIFFLEGGKNGNPTKYLIDEKIEKNNDGYAVNVSDLVDANFVTCNCVKADNKSFTVNSTDEKYFFSSDNKCLATGWLEGGEYKISANKEYELSEYTFELGEIFNQNNSDAKNFYFDYSSLKSGTHTKIKTTAGKFFLQHTNFSAKTPLEIVVSSELSFALKTDNETTLSVSNGYFYVYKDDNSKPKIFLSA